MLTFLSWPKPFTDPHIAAIQYNAIKSWSLLNPTPEIILFDDEPGTADICKELGLLHVQDVVRNGFGSALFNELIEKGRRIASHEILCYVNADIIFMNDFVDSVRRVDKTFSEYLMVGQRTDVNIESSLSFIKDWQKNLKVIAFEGGSLHPHFGIDYFVFPRQAWTRNQIPPFALGRVSFDNWIIYSARKRGIPVVDATSNVCAIHQNHGFSHFEGGRTAMVEGPESRLNRKMCGYVPRFFSPRSASHRISDMGIRRSLRGTLCLKVIGDVLQDIWQKIFRFPLNLTRPLRLRLGLTGSQIRSAGQGS